MRPIPCVRCGGSLETSSGSKNAGFLGICDKCRSKKCPVCREYFLPRRRAQKRCSSCDKDRSVKVATSEKSNNENARA